MKPYIILFILPLCSCSQLLLGLPDINVDNKTVHETKNVQEHKTIHYYQIDLKESSEIEEVKELGIGEKKIYFYPAP